MIPRLKSDWRTIAARAWSFRLAALAGVLSGAEAVLPVFSDAVPRGLFALGGVLISGAAMVARVVAQKDME